MNMHEEAAFASPSTKSRIGWMSSVVVCQSVAWLAVMAALAAARVYLEPLQELDVELSQNAHMLIDLSDTARYLWAVVVGLVLMEWGILGILRWGNAVRMLWAEIINMFVLAGLAAFLFYVIVVTSMLAKSMVTALGRYSS